MKASHTTHMAVLMVLMLTWCPPVPPPAHTLARTALYVVSLPPDPKVLCARFTLTRRVNNAQLHHHCAGADGCPSYHCCCVTACAEEQRLNAAPLLPPCNGEGEACPLHHHCSAGRSCADHHCCALCPESEFLANSEKSKGAPVHRGCQLLGAYGCLSCFSPLVLDHNSRL